MRKVKRWVRWLGVAAAMTIVAFAGVVLARKDRTFEAPYPDVRSSDDPAVVARGAYLVNGPAHCVNCHGESAARGHGSAAPSGEALSGGAPFRLPIGTVYAPNITPDPQTGVGRYRDEELARALRHGVGPDGRALLPFMPFANLSDEDLTAVISYLRSRPPVRHEVPRAEYNLLGAAVRALVLEPVGPRGAVPRSVSVEDAASYGQYLVHDVGNCAGCHTDRDLRTGENVGPALGGGLELASDEVPGRVFETPNLTPDPETGRITQWSEETFVARFRAPGPRGTPMPWSAFSRMSDDDLRAIYRYLRTVPATRHATAPLGATSPSPPRSAVGAASRGPA